MKVFHVLTDRNIGGAGRWLFSYLKHYDRDKFLVKVVLPSDSQLILPVQELGVEVFSLEEMDDKSFDQKAKAPLVKLFQEETPDVVHTHASLTARMAAKRAKVPLVVHTKHCMEGNAGSLAKKILRRQINRIYSDKVIAVSQAVRKSMIAGGVMPEQIVTIYNGIDFLEVPTSEEKSAICQRFGLSTDKKLVGIVARLEEVKDHQTFLLAAKEVLAKRQDVEFCIVGDGSLAKDLQEEAKNLGISDCVVFTGFVREVEEIERVLDISVITSKAEALCLSLIESMSAGVPAIGTDSGGVSEVIQHGENGYLVPIGDASALANRIDELLSDEEKQKKMRVKAKEFARKDFGAEEMARKIETLYFGGRNK